MTAPTRRGIRSTSLLKYELGTAAHSSCSAANSSSLFMRAVGRPRMQGYSSALAHSMGKR